VLLYSAASEPFFVIVCTLCTRNPMDPSRQGLGSNYCGQRMDRMVSHQTRPTAKLHIYAAQFCLIGRTATRHTQNASHEGKTLLISLYHGRQRTWAHRARRRTWTHIFHGTDQPCATCLYAVASGAVVTPQPGTRCGFFSFFGGLGSQKCETIQAKSSLHSIQQKS
jgi:hypothetical protein